MWDLVRAAGDSALTMVTDAQFRVRYVYPAVYEMFEVRRTADGDVAVLGLGQVRDEHPLDELVPSVKKLEW